MARDGETSYVPWKGLEDTPFTKALRNVLVRSRWRHGGAEWWPCSVEVTADGKDAAMALGPDGNGEDRILE